MKELLTPNLADMNVLSLGFIPAFVAASSVEGIGNPKSSVSLIVWRVVPWSADTASAKLAYATLREGTQI
jgi:hypothetical protein